MPPDEPLSRRYFVVIGSAGFTAFYVIALVAFIAHGEPVRFVLLGLFGLALFGSIALSEAPALRRVLERRRREQRGLCLECGYDLRATPEQCPECGATPGAAPGAATDANAS